MCGDNRRLEKLSSAAREQLQREQKDLKHRISEIRSLAMLKMEKNFIAHIEKGYPRQPYKELSPSYLILRIEEELAELKAVLKSGDVLGVMEECADVSNLTDYLFELCASFYFLDNKRGKYDGPGKTKV